MKLLQNSALRSSQKLLTWVLILLFATTTVAACANPSSSKQSGDIHKIKHIVIIMQENRSFDTYFGTFPGADGIPMKDGGANGMCQ